MKPLEYTSVPGNSELVIFPPDGDGDSEITINHYCNNSVYIPFSILKEWVLRCANVNIFENTLSTEQAAKQAGLSPRRIQQLSPKLINAGLAARIGKAIIIHADAISWIKTLPETRGRKKKY